MVTAEKEIAKSGQVAQRRKGEKLRKKKKFTIGKFFVYLTVFILVAFTLYPVVYILSMSFSSLEHLILQDVWLLPKDFTLEAYALLFKTSDLWVAYKNTIIYTFLGTAIGLTFTVALSYAVSQKNFYCRRIVIWFFMITMFFSGGVVPSYILINQLHLINSPLAIALPGAVTAWNMIITRTYFATISPSLFESASLDGAGEVRKLIFIALPVAKPIIAVLALYMIVGYWNTYFSALLYLEERELMPIQNYLQTILYDSNASGTPGQGSTIGGAMQIEQLKYSSIVVAIFPIMMVYPFLQKYFAAGIMVGSIKE